MKDKAKVIINRKNVSVAIYLAAKKEREEEMKKPFYLRKGIKG